GDHSGPLTNSLGDRYDTNINVAALQSLRIYDPSKNQTGMRIYTMDGVLLTAAWGEDPDVAQPGNPYIDAGTTVLPFPVPTLKKSAVIVTDAPPTGLSIGDTIAYTVAIDNKGLLPLGNTVIIDAPTTNLLYVTNSTYWNGSLIPDSSSGTAFPLDAPGFTIPVILSRGTSTFTYQCKVTSGGAVSNSVNIGGTAIFSMAAIPPASATPATVSLNFSDTNGISQSSYLAGSKIYVNMTNSVFTSNTLQTIAVSVTDTNTGDTEKINLVQVATNSTVFRNVGGLSSSVSSGLNPQDGTLYVMPGDTLWVSYTDPIYQDGATNTATIQVPTPNKQLYLVANGVAGTQRLSRVNPAATAGHGVTYNSVDIGNAGGAIAVDALSTNTSGNSVMVNSLTFGHITGAGANRLMLVAIGIGALADTSSPQTNCGSVSYGGVNLNRVGTVIDGYSTPTVRSEIWSLVNPPSGSNNVVVTLTNGATRPLVVGVMTLTGVNQTTPLGAFAAVQCGNSTSPTDSPIVTNSTAAGEMVFATAVIDGDGSDTPPPTMTPAAGQVSYLDQSALYRVRCVSSLKPGSATVPFTNAWAYGSSQQWAIGGVSIKPAAAGGTLTNTTTFAQSPAFALPFTMPVGGVISITNFITLTNGTFGANPNVTATLQTNGINYLTLSNPVFTAAAGTTNLIWSGTVPATVT
ncbi:MAG TPA: hypothetical protein VF607_16920, partial [Verrucomicrobiae bacterium]